MNTVQLYLVSSILGAYHICICLKNKLSLCLEINFLCIFSKNFMIMKNIRKYFGKSYIFNVLFRTILVHVNVIHIVELLEQRFLLHLGQK